MRISANPNSVSFLKPGAAAGSSLTASGSERYLLSAMIVPSRSRNTTRDFVSGYLVNTALLSWETLRGDSSLAPATEKDPCRLREDTDSRHRKTCHTKT